MSIWHWCQTLWYTDHSVSSPVMDGESTTPGHWLSLVVCILFSAVTLLARWHVRRPATKNLRLLSWKVLLQNNWMKGNQRTTITWNTAINTDRQVVNTSLWCIISKTQRAVYLIMKLYRVQRKELNKILHAAGHRQTDRHDFTAYSVLCRCIAWWKPINYTDSNIGNKTNIVLAQDVSCMSQQQAVQCKFNNTTFEHSQNVNQIS